MTTQVLLDLISSLPENNERYLPEDWKKHLDNHAANWRDIVADESNWDALITQSKPKRDKDDLIRAFVDVVGLRLVEYCIACSDEQVAVLGRQWFSCDGGDQYLVASNAGKGLIAKDFCRTFTWRNRGSDLPLSIRTAIWRDLSANNRQSVITTVWDGLLISWCSYMMASFGLRLFGHSRKLPPFHEYEDYSRDLRLMMDMGRLGHHPSGINPAKVLARPFILPKIDVNMVPCLIQLKELLTDLNDAADWAHFNDAQRQFISKTSPVPAALQPDWFFRSTGKTSASGVISKPIKTWFQQKQDLLAPGRHLPKWPTVIVSEEDPPLFRTNPGLRQWYEEDTDEEKAWDGSPDIESLLGYYDFEKKTIVLVRKGIDFCARSLFRGRGQPAGVPADDLIQCVLVHELGHWFNAEAITAGGVAWDTKPQSIVVACRTENPNHPDPMTPDAGLPETVNGNAWTLSSRCYHEAWAQWFAWLYGQEAHAGVRVTFDALERFQSAPYHAWRKLVSNLVRPKDGPYSMTDLRFSQERILQGLEWSRGHGIPVTFDDSNFQNTNMLKWLEASVL